MRLGTVLLTTAIVTLTACGSAESEPTTTSTAASTAAPASTTAERDPQGAGRASASTRAPTAKTIVTGLDVPWGIAFLPSGDALVAERSGRLKRVAKGTNRVRTVVRVPGVVAEGEGGLLGLAVSPDYRRDKWVYAYLTTAGDNRIVRFRLSSPRRLTTVVRGLRSGGIHNGGRIAFGPDGKLYAGVGDVGEGDIAQDPASQNGKILRMNPDGSVPSDNPIAGSRVWSLGHRNVQGLAWDQGKRLWASEFGQNTFDEVNLIQKGKNYGWPDVEGKGTDGGRFVSPQVTWPTDQASPSGVAYWKGALWVAALRGERLWRVPLNGAQAGTPRAFFVGRYGRIRTAVAAPDGSLWIATSNRDGRNDPNAGDDRILRLTS